MSEPAPVSPKVGWRSALHFSMAARASWCVGMTLVAVAAITWCVYRQDPKRLAWGDYMDWTQAAWLTLMVVLSCTATYWSVRIWIRDLPCADDGMERAWQTGLKALRDRGISLCDQPVYLVLGCDEPDLQSRLMESAGSRILWESTPSLTSPIRWYLYEDRVVLCLSELGCFGPVQSRLPNAKIASFSAGTKPRRVVRRAASKVDGHPASHFSESSLMGLRSHPAGAIQRNSSVEPSSISASPAALAVREPGLASNHASESIESWQDSELGRKIEQNFNNAERWLHEALVASEQADARFVLNEVHRDEWEPETLTSTEQVRLQQHLIDLARRLKSARAGIAPLNGILIRVATTDLVAVPRRIRECGRALRQDLLVLQEELGVQVPTLVACDQMQSDAGFRELIRRLGPDWSQRGLIGQHLSVRVSPEPSIVERLADEAAGCLKNTVLQQFEKDKVLHQPGNHRLFRLLISCRSSLAPSLREFLVEALSATPSEKTGHESFLVGGVYFAALGETPVERGFTHAIWQRMASLQEFLRWTNYEQRSQGKLRIAVWVLQAVSAAQAALLLFRLFAKLYYS